MNNEIQAAYLKDIVYEILDELEEIRRKKNIDLYDAGQKSAYTHILRTIQPWIDTDELKNFGLNIDIDKKYS